MRQNCKHLMTNLRMHKHYLMFSVVQVLLSIMILVYVCTISIKIVLDPEQNLKENMVIEAEIILTIAMMIDICIRIIAEREYFFKDYWNVIDLLAFILILLLISLYYIFELHSQLQIIVFSQIKTNIIEVDDSLGLILIILRYFIQITRIIIAIKQYFQFQYSDLIKSLSLEILKSFNSNQQTWIIVNIKQACILMSTMTHILLFDSLNYYMQIHKTPLQISHIRASSKDYYHRIQSANTLHSNRTVQSNIQNTISSKSQTRIATARPIRSFQLSTSNRKIKQKPTEEENFDEIISTPYDSELFKYKHKCTAPQHLRMEQIYRFIYDKKMSNKQKYSMQSKINQQALPVASGSISIMLNVARKDYGFNLQSFKKKIAPKSKFKMKWKTIQWLLKNRKDAIRQIFQNYQIIVKQAKIFPDGLNKVEFQGLLSQFGLGADKNLAEKLFYVFDEDSSGTVDYKELIVGLEVLKDDSIEEKLKIFFDLCDEDGSGKVSEKEIFNILKQNIINENDKYQLKMVIREMIKQVDLDGDGELNKEEILAAASRNPILRRLLEQTISNVRRIDAIIQNDLEEPFHQFVPSSANFIQQKEGIHFATQQKLLDALADIDKIDEKAKKIKEYTKPENSMGLTTYQGLQEKKFLDDSQFD